jgi:CubicO group peptidase (beta-lactamase class C family)
MDYMKFAEMLRRGGELNGVRILSPKTLSYMTTDHLPGAITATGTGEAPTSSLGIRARGMGFGLGFGIVTDPVEAGTIGSAGEFSWGGAAGTIFWVDPVEDIIVVGMIQLMRSPWPLRSELRILSNAAIVELNK